MRIAKIILIRSSFVILNGISLSELQWTDYFTTFLVCETLYKEYDAVEDHPECETVEKAECDLNRYKMGQLLWPWLRVLMQIITVLQWPWQPWLYCGDPSPGLQAGAEGR